MAQSDLIRVRELRKKAALKDKMDMDGVLAKLAEHSKTLGEHTQEISDLRKDLNKKIAEIKAEIKLKIDFVTNLMSGGGKSDKAYVDAEVAKLRSEIDTKTQEVKDLIKDLDTKVNQEVSDLKAMDTTLDDYAKATAQRVEDLHKDYTQKFKDMDETIAKMDIRITANFNEINKLKIQNTKQKTIDQEFRDFMKEMKNKINIDIPKQFEDLHKAVEDLEDDNTVITEILNNTEDVLLDGLMGPFKGLSGAMKARLEFIKASGYSKTDIDTTIDGLKGDIRAANGKLTALEAEILKANAAILQEAMDRGVDIKNVEKLILNLNQSLNELITQEKSNLETEFNKVMNKYGLELKGVTGRVTALETWQTNMNVALYGNEVGDPTKPLKDPKKLGIIKDLEKAGINIDAVKQELVDTAKVLGNNAVKDFTELSEAMEAQLVILNASIAKGKGVTPEELAKQATDLQTLLDNREKAFKDKLGDMIVELGGKFKGLTPDQQKALAEAINILSEGAKGTFQAQIDALEGKVSDVTGKVDKIVLWQTAINDALYGEGGDPTNPGTDPTKPGIIKKLTDLGVDVDKIKAELVDAAKAFGNAAAADFSELSEAITKAGAGANIAELNALKDKVGTGLDHMIEELAAKYSGLDPAAQKAITDNLDILLKGQLADFAIRIETLEIWEGTINNALYGKDGNATSPKDGSIMKDIMDLADTNEDLRDNIKTIDKALSEVSQVFGATAIEGYGTMAARIQEKINQLEEDIDKKASNEDLENMRATLKTLAEEEAKKLETKLNNELETKINKLKDNFASKDSVQALDQALAKLKNESLKLMEESVDNLTKEFNTFVEWQTNINEALYGAGGDPTKSGTDPTKPGIIKKLTDLGVDVDKIKGQLTDIAEAYFTKTLPVTYEDFATNLKAKISELEAKAMAPADLEKQIKDEITKQAEALGKKLDKELDDKIAALKDELSDEAIELINQQLQDAVKFYVDMNINKLAKGIPSSKILDTKGVVETLNEIKKLLSEEGTPEALEKQINKLDFVINFTDKPKLHEILKQSATHTKLSAVEEAQIAKIIATAGETYINSLAKKDPDIKALTPLKEWFIKDSYYSAAVGLNEINIKSLYAYDDASQSHLEALQKMFKSDAKAGLKGINKTIYDDIGHSITSFEVDKHLNEPKKYVDLNDTLKKALDNDATFKNEIIGKYNKLAPAEAAFTAYENVLQNLEKKSGTLEADIKTLKTQIAQFSNIKENDVSIKFFVTSTKTQQDILKLFKSNLTSNLKTFINSKKDSKDFENVSKNLKIEGAVIDPVKLNIINKIFTEEKASINPISNTSKIILEKFILEQDKNIRDVLKKELEENEKAAGSKASKEYKMLQDDIKKLNEDIDKLEKDIESVVIPKSIGDTDALKDLEVVNANIKKLVIYNGDKDKIETVKISIGNLDTTTEKTALEKALNHIKTVSSFEIFKDKLAIESSIKQLDTKAGVTGYDDFISKDFTISLAQHISSTVIKSLITKGMTTKQFKDALSLDGITINADLQNLKGVKTALDFTNGKVQSSIWGLMDLKLSSTNDGEEFKLTHDALTECKKITMEAIEALEGTINTDKLNEAHWQDAKINLEHAQKVFQLIDDNGYKIEDANSGIKNAIGTEIEGFTHIGKDQIHLNVEMIKDIH